jgi:hypothetical protein
MLTRDTIAQVDFVVCLPSNALRTRKLSGRNWDAVCNLRYPESRKLASNFRSKFVESMLVTASKEMMTHVSPAFLREPHPTQRRRGSELAGPPDDAVAPITIVLYTRRQGHSQNVSDVQFIPE